jgi:hypothetical protein
MAMLIEGESIRVISERLRMHTTQVERELRRFGFSQTRRNRSASA